MTLKIEEDQVPTKFTVNKAFLQKRKKVIIKESLLSFQTFSYNLERTPEVQGTRNKCGKGEWIILEVKRIWHGQLAISYDFFLIRIKIQWYPAFKTSKTFIVSKVFIFRNPAWICLKAHNLPFVHAKFHWSSFSSLASTQFWVKMK